MIYHKTQNVGFILNKLSNSERVVSYCLYRAILPGDALMYYILGAPFIKTRSAFIKSLSQDNIDDYIKFQNDTHVLWSELCQKLQTYTDISELQNEVSALVNNAIVDTENNLANLVTKYPLEGSPDEELDYSPPLLDLPNLHSNIINLCAKIEDLKNIFHVSKYWFNEAVKHMEGDPEFYSNEAIAQVSDLRLDIKSSYDDNSLVYNHTINDRVLIESIYVPYLDFPILNSNITIEYINPEDLLLSIDNINITSTVRHKFYGNGICGVKNILGYTTNNKKVIYGQRSGAYTNEELAICILKEWITTVKDANTIDITTPETLNTLKDMFSVLIDKKILDDINDITIDPLDINIFEHPPMIKPVLKDNNIYACVYVPSTLFELHNSYQNIIDF